MTKMVHKKNVWEVIIISIIMILVVLGLFFYHNFFRQNQARLIETVPLNATYILQINDNEKFIKEIPQLLPYLNEMLSVSSLPGLEFFIDKLALSKPTLLLSGHYNGTDTKLLLSSACSETDFLSLLAKLKIDERNFISFDNSHIYTFGTHLKTFSFSFNNNVFSISEDVELLKKSIVQHKYPKNMLSNEEFSEVYNLVSKNVKQNWLLIQNSNFFEMNTTLLAEHFQNILQPFDKVKFWSAFQLRFADKEIILAGYISKEAEFFHKFGDQGSNNEIPIKIMPFSTSWYMAFNMMDNIAFVKSFSTSTAPIFSRAIEEYKTFNPNSIYSFALTKDTVVYHFFAVKKDTNNFKSEDLLPDTLSQRESIKFKGNMIYRSKLTGFEELFTILQKSSSFNYFTEYQGYYIFSDTTTSLQIYYNDILQHNFGGQPLYRFVRNNLPSHFAQEFCILFPDQVSNNSIFLTQEKNYANTKKGIMLFSYSFSASNRSFIPVNVYIKFK